MKGITPEEMEDIHNLLILPLQKNNNINMSGSISLVGRNDVGELLPWMKEKITQKWLEKFAMDYIIKRSLQSGYDI